MELSTEKVGYTGTYRLVENRVVQIKKNPLVEK